MPLFIKLFCNDKVHNMKKQQYLIDIHITDGSFVSMLAQRLKAKEMLSNKIYLQPNKT